MSLRTLLLALLFAIWMTEHPDPRRAGQGQAAATSWCPECGLTLFASGDLYVCGSRHIWHLSESTGELSRLTGH